MKKMISLLLALALCLSLCACGGNGSTPSGEQTETAPLIQSDFDKAVAMYDANDYAGARALFAKVDSSEEVERYLCLCAWGMVRDYLEKEGSLNQTDDQYDVEDNTKVESTCEISKQGKRVVVTIQSTEVVSFPILKASQTTVTNTTVSFDGKNMAPELEAKADITFRGTKGGDTFHNVGKCKWDTASYQAGKDVQWEEYIYIGTDGEMDDTREAPAFNRRVAMQQTIMASCLALLLEDADMGLTMADLGFTNY